MVRRATLLLLIASTSSCGLLGKRVSEEDCTKWDEHYRKALEATARKQLSKCKDDPAAKGYLKNLESNVAASADGLATGCHSVQKIGSYTAEEEKCFLNADDARAWSKCTFKSTSAVKMYATSGDSMMKSVDSMCSGDADDDADDPKPKKSKKTKKSEDDDE